jgi:hypothetical protein
MFFFVCFLLYAHRHRSISGATGHIILTPANQLMEEYNSEPPENLVKMDKENSITLLWPEWGSNPIPSDLIDNLFIFHRTIDSLNVFDNFFFFYNFIHVLVTRSLD